MGGFPKFPIPRYLNTHAWVLNKHWKRNLANIIAPLALANFVFFRMLSLNTYDATPYGEYIDPNSPDAAKGMRL